LVVDAAQHSVSIQGRAPSVIESRHGHASPSIYRNEAIGNAGVGDEQNLKTATAGLAIKTADLTCGRGVNFGVHLKIF
jgi:hypothetical protein